MTRQEFKIEARDRLKVLLALQGVDDPDPDTFEQLVEFAVAACIRDGTTYDKFDWTQLRIDWYGIKAHQAVEERRYYGHTLH